MNYEIRELLMEMVVPNWLQRGLLEFIKGDSIPNFLESAKLLELTVVKR